MITTATDPDGIVHAIATPTTWTMCHRESVSWSREVTMLQAMDPYGDAGLILFCEACKAMPRFREELAREAGEADPRKQAGVIDPPPLYHCPHESGCPNTVLTPGELCPYHVL